MTSGPETLDHYVDHQGKSHLGLPTMTLEEVADLARCPDCSGTGMLALPSKAVPKATCSRCGGNGYVNVGVEK